MPASRKVKINRAGATGDCNLEIEMKKTERANECAGARCLRRFSIREFLAIANR
jgi:hypothetical protein